MGGESWGEGGAEKSVMESHTGNYERRPASQGLGSRMTALSRYLAPLESGRAVLLWGEHLRAVAAAAAAWGVARGAEVLVVDAANRFDPYQLVRQARRYGLAPAGALSRVQVARAFTSHQLVRLLKEILPPRLQSGALVVLLGPVSLFYDEQVPLAERRRLFKDLTRLLQDLKSRAALLLLQPLLPQAAANQHFGRLLARVIDYFVEVGNRGEDRAEATRRAAPAVPALPRGNLWPTPSHPVHSRPPKGDF